MEAERKVFPAGIGEAQRRDPAQPFGLGEELYVIRSAC